MSRVSFVVFQSSPRMAGCTTNPDSDRTVTRAGMRLCYRAHKIVNQKSWMTPIWWRALYVTILGLFVADADIRLRIVIVKIRMQAWQ